MLAPCMQKRWGRGSSTQNTGTLPLRSPPPPRCEGVCVCVCSSSVAGEQPPCGQHTWSRTTAAARINSSTRLAKWLRRTGEWPTRSDGWGRDAPRKSPRTFVHIPLSFHQGHTLARANKNFTGWRRTHRTALRCTSMVHTQARCERT